MLGSSRLTARWERAQAAELAWWQNWSRLPFYQNHSFPEYWKSVAAMCLADAKSAQPGTVIDVGCGPHGAVRYLFPNAQLKLGVDPLADRFDERPKGNSRTVYVSAIGEMIPVKDEVADLVFCINVLDHVMDARAILREIHRILKPGGRLLLEVHTFPRIFVPFMFFDRPHTFHWTRRDVERMVSDAGYSILRTETRGFPIALPWYSLFGLRYWKYIFGRLFLRLSYVYCGKSHEL